MRRLSSSFFIALLLFSTLSFADDAPEQQAASSEAVPLKELRLFSEVFDQVHRYYVKEVSDQTLLQYAIEGMLSRLDPHSSWLDKDDYLSLQETTNGEFAGIGVEVVRSDGRLKIVTPIDNSPAQRAGIKADDVIIKIDNTALRGLSLNESVDLMRGKVGSEISLTIMREGQKPFTLKLKREIIKIDSVKSRLIDEHYVYLRIAQFQKNTADDAKKQLQSFDQQAMNGIILDLRNNPGGLLNAAVSLCDLFIKKGLIVYTQGRTKEADEKYFASGNAIYADIPMVVLINQGTASAAEIVSGALQDYRRALILGTQSFGKGSVQTILPIDDTHGVKLTTALYYTPLGRSIQAKGISPDIRVNNAKIEFKKNTPSLSEADLAHHIDEQDSDSDEPVSDAVISDDYPLHEALNMLKAIHLTQSAQH